MDQNLDIDPFYCIHSTNLDIDPFFSIRIFRSSTPILPLTNIEIKQQCPFIAGDCGPRQEAPPEPRGDPRHRHRLQVALGRRGLQDVAGHGQHIHQVFFVVFPKLRVTVWHKTATAVRFYGCKTLVTTKFKGS